MRCSLPRQRDLEARLEDQGEACATSSSDERESMRVLVARISLPGTTSTADVERLESKLNEAFAAPVKPQPDAVPFTVEILREGTAAHCMKLETTLINAAYVTDLERGRNELEEVEDEESDVDDDIM